MAPLLSKRQQPYRIRKINLLAFRPDGQQLFITMNNKTVRIIAVTNPDYRFHQTRQWFAPGWNNNWSSQNNIRCVVVWEPSRFASVYSIDRRPLVTTGAISTCLLPALQDDRILVNKDTHMSLSVSPGSSAVKKLNFTSLDTCQKGPTCKLAALRTCMKLLIPDNCHPLRKNKNANVTLSVRSIAKNYGSSQGEVTSPFRLGKIAQGLGLKADPRRFKNQAQMEGYIYSAIDKGLPVIVFAQIDPVDLYPSDKPDFRGQWFEHACVVVGYNKAYQSLFVHDGQKVQMWGVADLYNSSWKVLKRRDQETFIKLLKTGHETLPRYENNQAGENLRPVESSDFDTVESHDTSMPEPMDWETSDPCQELAETINCSHYQNNDPCKYHEVSEFLVSNKLQRESLEELQKLKRLIIRQSTQEPDANFHKLLVIIDKEEPIENCTRFNH